MQKYLAYLLFILALPLVAGCSKEEQELDPISSEAQISNETGISFANSPGLGADLVVYKLKSGADVEKEYGQSLSGYNYIKLEPGPKTIFQMQVFKNGEEIPFNAYTKDDNGARTEVRSTSIILIKDKQVFKIVLENDE